jgi:outer membrane protein assembly factor BamD
MSTFLWHRKIFFLYIMAAILPLLGGCSAWNSVTSMFSSPPPEEMKVTGTDADMTREAMEFFNTGRYMMAEEIFQKIRDRYPFSPYATVAELRLADCKYYRDFYLEALPLYENFEQLHPTNDAIPYVIYQEGACYYEMMDTPDRDQSNTLKMIDTYRRLLTRFPESPFSYEAKKRIKEGTDLLAEHEYVVAEWYSRVDRPACAVNRLERLIMLYPDASIRPEAEELLASQKAIMVINSEEAKILPDTEPWYRKLWPF